MFHLWWKMSALSEKKRLLSNFYHVSALFLSAFVFCQSPYHDINAKCIEDCRQIVNLSNRILFCLLSQYRITSCLQSIKLNCMARAVLWTHFAIHHRFSVFIEFVLEATCRIQIAQSIILRDCSWYSIIFIIPIIPLLLLFL